MEIRWYYHYIDIVTSIFDDIAVHEYFLREKSVLLNK